MKQVICMPDFKNKNLWTTCVQHIVLSETQFDLHQWFSIQSHPTFLSCNKYFVKPS